MTTNRKTTTVLIVLAAVAATLLVAGTVAVASNHSAFAWKNKEYKKDKYQRDDNKYQNDGYQKDEGKYQNDGSYGKYVMGSERGSGKSITVIAANEQSSECETYGNNSPIGTNACQNSADATADNSGGINGEDAK